MTRDPSMIASDPGVSAWVAANAGAGKTYTLANRVARLLMLPGTRPEHILCLTFTKAAAAEMQGRLFKQLGAWAMLPDEELRAEIARIGGEPHGDLRQARRLFASALETPGGLKVLTIHAFCQTLLSRFPIEAGVPPAFEVLDDQSAREMIAEARLRILERAGLGETALADAVTRLVSETSESRLTAIFDSALGGDRRKLDRFFDSEGDFALRVRRAHGLEAGETAAQVADSFCGALDREIEQLKEAQGWLGGGSANDLKSATRLAAVLAKNLPHEKFAALGNFLLTDVGEPRKQLATKKLADQRPELLAYLTSLQSRFCDTAERHRQARAADLTEAALVLVDAVRRDYARAKQQRGVLDYDDLIIRTRNLLDRQGAAAWVLYKLDGGIEHVLIDEAQDTSPEQWEIVKKLTEEFFAGTGRERRNPRTIFAVGDEKQSIFSFQGADPTLFDRNRHYFADLAASAGHPFIDQPLIMSRRSAPDILRFVDTVFASEAARSGLTYSGAVIEHQAWRTIAPGGIEFWPALRPDDADDPDPWAPVDAVQKDSPAARLASQVAAKIAAWLNSGARLAGHDAPIRPQDIMILLPRREPFGGEVIRQLKMRGVPVAGADRVRLAEQIAAMDLIALGRFVLQREDDLTLAALLRSPLCGLSENDLYDLAHDRRGDLWSALVAAQGKFAAAHAFLSHMLERADYAPPFEFYSHALTAPLLPGKMGAKEKLLARLGPESADAIDEFLSLTLVHERSHSPSLEGFLDWVERGGLEIKRDMERGRDEVRVMTVHGAKGLEADIVILPDTASLPGGLNRNEGLLHADGEVLFPLPKQDAPQIVRKARAAANEELMREHRRLLYVALTRARDRLCICGFAGKTGVKPGSWYEFAQAAARELDMARGDDEIRIVGTVADEAGEKETAAKALDPLPGWVSRSAPPEPSSPRLIRPSDVSDGEPPTVSPLGAGAARFKRGNVVHALLARLPEIAPERRRDVALKFVRANGLKDAEALVAEILAVLDDPLFAAAFGPGSQAEAGLLAELPELGEGARINGRIDRLAVSDAEVLILDFKTNRPSPDSEAVVPPIYLAQMALYRAGARKVFPGRRVVCGLVFTDGPRLLQLSDVVLDAQLAGISARLDPGPPRS
jgi:ATP-dependent helicase/nuclease subunit A